MVNWSPTLQTAVSDLVSNFSFRLYCTIVCLLLNWFLNVLIEPLLLWLGS